MRYVKFKFENFRGIESAEIDLSPRGGGIYTLIGLNESGKTTLLEAISAFDLNNDEVNPARLVGNEGKINPTSFIPKSMKSNFSGSITLEATVEFEGDEREKLIDELEQEFSCEIDREGIPERICLQRNLFFENSDFKKLEKLIQVYLRYRLKDHDEFVNTESVDHLWGQFVIKVNKLVPQILYFSTFIFNIPDYITLNPDQPESSVNRIYREIIRDVGGSLSNPIDMNTHIVHRFKTGNSTAPWNINLIANDRDRFDQVQAVIDDLSLNLTETIFDRWAKIFGGDFLGREIVVRLMPSGTHSNLKINVSLAIKDNNLTYQISERSLGFRWFFSFLLFTHYRVSANSQQKTLFLFDEPASNLHSAAQSQLVDSFSNVATDKNQIMYSTHSHYMINPHWLDQAFIVSNSAIDYDDTTRVQRRSKKIANRIHVQKYRSFVGANPDKITYFQPILDKLAVTPSRLDNLSPAVMVEGKGDFIYLTYARNILLKSKYKYSIIPTRGATGMQEIAGLYFGWGLDFAICLDADKEGFTAARKYEENWATLKNNIFTLDEIDPRMKGKGIEGMLDDQDIKKIRAHFAIEETPSKGQKQLFFSEMLASSARVSLSDKFVSIAQAFDKRFGELLG